MKSYRGSHIRYLYINRFQFNIDSLDHVGFSVSKPCDLLDNVHKIIFLRAWGGFWLVMVVGAIIMDGCIIYDW